MGAKSRKAGMPGWIVMATEPRGKECMHYGDLYLSSATSVLSDLRQVTCSLWASIL